MVPQTSSAFSQSVENYPVSEIDPYSNEVLIDPWETFADLQRLGSAVWLTKYEKFALTRYDDVVRALKDTSAFSSASGVMMNDDMNQVLRGNTLCSDGEDHRRLRRIIAKPLTPMALNSLKVEITEKAEELVDRLVAKGSFCAVPDRGWRHSMPQFDPELIQVMRGVLDDVMSRVPLEIYGTTAKSYLAEAFLKAAAQGHTTYSELMAAATNQIQTILSILTQIRRNLP